MTDRTRTAHRSITSATASLVAALLLPALAAAPASADADGPECDDTSTVAGAPDLTRRLADGIVLRRWVSRVADVSLVASEPRSAALRVWTASPGRVQTVRTALDADAHAVAAVNGDFFSRSRLGYQPASSVMVGGQAKYLVAGSLPALTIDPRGTLHATTVRAGGTVSFRWSDVRTTTVVTVVDHKKVSRTVTRRTTHLREVALTGMNTAAKLTKESTVLFTRTWPASAPLPPHVRVLHTPDHATSTASQPPVSASSVPSRPWLSLGRTAAARLRDVPARAVATVRWGLRAGDGSTVRDAIGRGAVLLRDGRVITDCQGVERPRTAVGWDDQGHLWLLASQGGDIVVAPGGRMGGTTNFQMARWLHQLGATDGVTLDGGGSTDLEVRTAAGAHRVDLPEGVFARPVPNGLIMVPKG